MDFLEYLFQLGFIGKVFRRLSECKQVKLMPFSQPFGQVINLQLITTIRRVRRSIGKEEEFQINAVMC